MIDRTTGYRTVSTRTPPELGGDPDRVTDPSRGPGPGASGEEAAMTLDATRGVDLRAVS